MASETLRFTISINSIEHQSVFDDLSSHKLGTDRARRARWLMISGLAALRHDTPLHARPFSQLDANPPQPLSISNATQMAAPAAPKPRPGTIEAFDEMDFDVTEFKRNLNRPVENSASATAPGGNS
jgi:hypothetical protein